MCCQHRQHENREGARWHLDSRRPQASTPTYLAEKIVIYRSVLGRGCKQVTAVFTDLKRSMEMLAEPLQYPPSIG